MKIPYWIFPLNFSYLFMNRFSIGRSFDIADDSKSEWHITAHHRKHRVQSIVFLMSIVNKYVVDGITILTDCYRLQFQAVEDDAFVMRIIRSSRVSNTTIATRK